MSEVTCRTYLTDGTRVSLTSRQNSQFSQRSLVSTLQKGRDVVQHQHKIVSKTNTNKFNGIKQMYLSWINNLAYITIYKRKSCNYGQNCTNLKVNSAPWGSTTEFKYIIMTVLDHQTCARVFTRISSTLDGSARRHHQPRSNLSSLSFPQGSKQDNSISASIFLPQSRGLDSIKVHASRLKQIIVHECKRVNWEAVHHCKKN